MIGSAYLAGAALNIWLVRVRSLQGEGWNLKTLIWSSFWDASIALLCLTGRSLLKRGTKECLTAGGFLISVALALMLRTWVPDMLTVGGPYVIGEAVLIWPWMLYSIAYAIVQPGKRPT